MGMAQVKLFFAAFTKETHQAFYSVTIHWLTWLFPLLLYALVSADFSSSVSLDLPVAVVDNDHSRLSRKIIRDLDAASHAKTVVKNDGIAQALESLRRADTYGLLYIPASFEADVLSGKQPSSIFYYNALYYGSGLSSTLDYSSLMSSLNAEYTGILSTSVSIPLPSSSQVSLSYDSLFNATGSSIYYQQFAAVIHLLQLFVIGCTIFVLSESKSLLDTKPFVLNFLGKMFYYTVMYTILLTLQLSFLVIFSGAKVSNNAIYLLFIGFFYVIAAQSIGVLLFSLTKSIVMAFSFIGIFVGIAMTYSGIAVPELSMPWPARVIANMEPLTHALSAMFDVFLRKANLMRVLQVCLLLMCYPIVTVFVVRKRLFARLGSL